MSLLLFLNALAQQAQNNSNNVPLFLIGSAPVQNLFNSVPLFTDSEAQNQHGSVPLYADGNGNILSSIPLYTDSEVVAFDAQGVPLYAQGPSSVNGSVPLFGTGPPGGGGNMANNRRIYFAIQAVGFSPDGSTTYIPAHGVQTLGLNTKFNLDQVFELGQLTLYENVELIPDIEITIEKVLDGWPLLYHLATTQAVSASLAGRSTCKCLVALSIYPDVSSASSGNPITQCQVSGVFVSTLSYAVDVNGPAKESLTLVANNKNWFSSGFNFTPNVFGLDLPYQSGVVNRRQHIVFQPANPTGTVFQQQYTKLPLDIPDISTSGTNDPDVSAGGAGFNAHLQSIKTTANLGREQLLELGRRGPYFRYVNFPVETRTEYDVISERGDMVQATEAGVLAGGQNINTQTLSLKMQEGLYIDLGTRNKCTGVNYSGANAGSRGGNAVMTFSYQSFNDFTVLHPQDPGGFTS